MKHTFSLALVALLVSACSTDDPVNPTTEDAQVIADAASADAVQAADVTPPEPTLPALEDGWTFVETGGETVCSRGTEFFFLVRKGTVNKVVVEFMGGGACWNAQTCGFANAIFNEDIAFLKSMWGADSIAPGIYDHENPDNPFKDWYHIFIPYCTGDIHWGDAVVEYGSGDGAFTLHHKGAVNTRAVLDWMGENFSAPEQIFVTGCSAGAYGALGWAPHIIQQFPDAKVSQMGDSGVGIITESFFLESFPVWNVWDMLPTWIDGLDVDVETYSDLELHDIYGAVANHYPDARFTQFTSAFDKTQIFYYQAMGGGDTEGWSAKMFASIEKARGMAPNFKAYIGPGNQHCIIPYEELYDVTSDGESLIEWIAKLVGDEPVPNVTCTACE